MRSPPSSKGPTPPTPIFHSDTLLLYEAYYIFHLLQSLPSAHRLKGQKSLGSKIYYTFHSLIQIYVCSLISQHPPLPCTLHSRHTSKDLFSPSSAWSNPYFLSPGTWKLSSFWFQFFISPDAFPALTSRDTSTFLINPSSYDHSSPFQFCCCF